MRGRPVDDDSMAGSLLNQNKNFNENQKKNEVHDEEESKEIQFEGA